MSSRIVLRTAKLAIGCGVLAVSLGAMLAITPHARSQDAAQAKAPAPSQADDPAATSALTPLQEARDLVEVLEARLAIKRAELRECEVHVAQAKRRLAAMERVQAIGYERAKDRVTWAEAMYRKGYMTKGTFEAEKEMADRLRPRSPAPKPETH